MIADDGYGIQDCLGEGRECGRAAADAWRQAQGHGAAVAFGRAPDAGSPPPPGAGLGGYVVACGD